MNTYFIDRDTHKKLLCSAQTGASLIVVLLILMVVSILGMGAAQVALMSERGARNDRDQQVAWQSAEAALIDAELDLLDPKICPTGVAQGSCSRPTAARNTLTNQMFNGKNSIGFLPGCGKSSDNANWVGLCETAVSGTKPIWLTVDFTDTSSDARTTAFGTYTGRTLSIGTGIQPAKAPRYIIERLIDDKDATPQTYMYRVTAMGFGPRADIQAVLQMLYRN